MAQVIRNAPLKLVKNYDGKRGRKIKGKILKSKIILPQILLSRHALHDAENLSPV
jgi:hypothetical protein